ncbi:MAG TPA: tetratricopeptide repeat protein, partial [Candidatus Angelobacter sp.]|nr:tetratricopeptide repeat protein [Candidatus Angelobacter sp.]
MRALSLLVAALLAGLGPVLIAQNSSLAGVEALVRQGKLDDAGNQLQAILQKQPSNAPALSLLGTVRQRQGNWPEAETMFRHAVASNPRSMDACQELAALLRDEARWPEAVKQYESCRKLAPANMKVAVELATVYEKNADYTKSLALVALIPAASRPTKLLPAIAADYIATNNAQKSEEAVADVLRHAADDPAIVPALANRLLDHGMTGDASELLR